jgi:hypothetical protein
VRVNLLRLDQVDIHASDNVFRQSSTHGLLALGSFAAAAVVVAIAGMTGVIPWPLAGFTMAVLACFALVAGMMASRSSSRDNWLLAADDRRLLINLRSYLNTAFPVAEPCVVELGKSDVLGFRAVTARSTGYDAANDATQGDTVFLDIVMASHVEAEVIAERLEVERGLRNRGSAWRHYPVTVPDRATLRIEWRGRHGRIAPGIEAAIRVLASIATPLPPASETIDFGTPARRPNNADTDREVRALAHQGRIVEATLLAARSLNLSTAEARRYVEQRLGAKLLPESGNGDGPGHL